jgi:hypothetical protein
MVVVTLTLLSSIYFVGPQTVDKIITTSNITIKITTTTPDSTPDYLPFYTQNPAGRYNLQSGLILQYFNRCLYYRYRLASNSANIGFSILNRPTDRGGGWSLVAVQKLFVLDSKTRETHFEMVSFLR